MTLTTALASSLRDLLAATPSNALPITYQQAANALGLSPPRTIQRIAQALEQLMREDAAAGKPFIATLVVSRSGKGLPAAGFFELAAELGRFTDTPSQQEAFYYSEREQAINEWCRS
ncbi:hypothetical protein ELY33_12860 [Vreelandella andesensis]|uniref:vWA-MoxR associated protein middle region 0 domain-containing protein n=1 Tax=Vreelandella andesensis TaxID=447567 RepID=A0A433KIU4_9GAMM|nr:hypothetical protein [Halomonas andesensis]RUR29503.1 hypothetical protein ELY33_12860 [Halomonas andesensis]